MNTAIDPSTGPDPAEPDQSLDFEPRFLAGHELKLQTSPGGLLQMTLHGRDVHERVTARRLRPLQDPQHYISLADGDGQEIGILRDPDELDGPSRAALEAELDCCFHTPMITQVLSIRQRFRMLHLHVQTDHGEAQCIVRSEAQSVRQLPGGRLLLVDVHDNPYVIADLQALGPKAMRHLRWAL